MVNNSSKFSVFLKLSNFLLISISFLHLAPVFFAPEVVRKFFSQNWMVIDLYVFFAVLIYNLIVKTRGKRIIFLIVFYLFLIFPVKTFLLELAVKSVYSVNKNRNFENFFNPFLGMRMVKDKYYQDGVWTHSVSFYYREGFFMQDRLMYSPDHQIRPKTEGAQFVDKIFDENWYIFSPSD